MKIFEMDSPVVTFLNKIADLLWLNILTIICCIPIITVGASLTAMHYMALKIVRNEECYITKGFFKSFKQNFKQATAIWMILFVILAVLVGDFYILFVLDMEFSKVFIVMIMAVGIMVLFTAAFAFPLLSKFDNTVKQTIRNAFMVSILQFPKTIMMIMLGFAPFVLFLYYYQMFPFLLLYGLSAPAYASAFLYNKFFQKMEDDLLSKSENAEEEENDERIFRDELDESVISEQNV